MSFKDNLKSFGSSLPTTLGNAAIGGAFNLATSAFNARLAERAAQNEYNRQLDFWSKQNEYNAPLSQRKRLEDAGFNPAAAINGVAGNNTAGGISSVPANEVDKRGRIDLGALNNSLALLGQMESVGANTDLMKRQIELSFVEEILKNNTAFGIELDNETKKELLKWIPHEKGLTIEKFLAEISNIKAGTAKTERQIEEIDYNIALTTQQISNLVSDKAYKDALTTTENALRDSKVTNLDLQNAAQSFQNYLEVKFGEQDRLNRQHIDSEQFQILKSHILDWNATYQMKRDLLAANLSEAEANAVIASTKSLVENMDYNYYKTLVGDGNDWFSPLGMLIHGLWNKNGLGIDF